MSQREKQSATSHSGPSNTKGQLYPGIKSKHVIIHVQVSDPSLTDPATVMPQSVHCAPKSAAQSQRGAAFTFSFKLNDWDLTCLILINPFCYFLRFDWVLKKGFWWHLCAMFRYVVQWQETQALLCAQASMRTKCNNETKAANESFSATYDHSSWRCCCWLLWARLTWPDMTCPCDLWNRVIKWHSLTLTMNFESQASENDECYSIETPLGHDMVSPAERGCHDPTQSVWPSQQQPFPYMRPW